MFLHNYLYRLKCIIRDKETMFWSFLFPIILATLFNLAFSNILSIEHFSTVNLGIVDNAEYRENPIFIKAINSMSTSEQSSETNGLFNLTYVSREEAGQLLDENKIAGYIYFNDGMKLVVNESGLKQTLIKSFLDEFKQTSSTMHTIIKRNPNAINNGLIDETLTRKNYLEMVSASKASPNAIVTYFYALMGMACMYGAFLGLKEVIDLQANLSSKGARVSVAPTYRLKQVFASIFAAITVQLFNIFMLLGYLVLILKVDFGNQLGFIVLTCIIGSITGVTFGTTIGSISNKGEGIKTGILIGSVMTMAFCSGLMYDEIKYIVSTKIPILAYLNPVNLITDSLYALYYYSTYSRFITNIVILSFFALVFSTITYLTLRRQRYASL